MTTEAHRGRSSDVPDLVDTNLPVLNDAAVGRPKRGENMTDAPDRLLTPTEAAARLNVSRAALRRSPRLRAELRPIRLGYRTVRYAEADLVRIVSQALA